MKNHHSGLTRRDFLRGTITAALGASIIGVEWTKAAQDVSRSSLVTLVRDKKAMDIKLGVDSDILKKMFEESLTHFTGQKNIKEALLNLVNQKDTIGLVTTSHLNPTHKELIDIVKTELMDVGIPKEKIIMAQGGPEKVKACTALIALPALKAHWLTGIGTVLKNYITFSGRPSDYHDDDNSKLGEIWNLPDIKGKTKLVLVDALFPLCDKGPQVNPRYKWNYNGLIAGTDPVAVETVCLKIITEKRKALRGEPWPLSPPPLCVEAADKIYGLGTSKWKEIKIEHYGWEQNLLL